MGIEIALICIQVLILIAFMPIKIRLDGHISLAHMSLEADVKAFSARVVRLRLKRANGEFKFTLNGKKPPKRRFDADKLRSLPTEIANSAVLIRGRMVAKIGARDAMTAAMAGGLIAALCATAIKESRVFIASSDSFEMDVGIRTKINLLQIAQLAL